MHGLFLSTIQNQIKMKSVIKLLICLVSLTIIFQSCRNDFDGEITIEDPIPGTVINVTGNVFGKVVDSNNNPIIGAVVISNSESVITNEFGVFIIEDILMNSAGTYIKVEKSGYFDGSRRIYPELNATSYMEVMLLDKNMDSSISAQDGGSITMPNGSKVDLPAGGIIDANGNNYNGTVNVAMQWLDPTSDDLGRMMPGNLDALNLEEELVVLQSYGMLAVELETPSGEALNLGNGGVATLTFPVPSEIISSAPSTIPLWFFDEIVGIWKEDGMASLIGDEYVGQVSHFTFWNCDVPFPLVQLSGCFEGRVLSNTSVEIEVISTGLNGYTYTNDQGCFSGPVPMNENLKIKLLDKCGTILYEEEIGSFDEDTDLGTIIYTILSDADVISINGTLVDCDVLPVDSGILRVKSDDGDDFYYVEGGDFTVSNIICPSTTSIFISGSEPADDQTIFTDLVEYAVDAVVNAGNVDTCSDPSVLPDSYAKVTLDGDSYIYDLGMTSGGLESYIQTIPSGIELWMSFRNIFPYDTSSVTFTTFQLEEGLNIVTEQNTLSLANFNGLFDVGENISVKSADDEVEIFISDLGEVGEPVTGTITDDVLVQNAELISISPSGISFLPLDTIGVFPLTVEFRVNRK